MTTEAGSARVTPEELLNELRTLHEMVVRIDERLRNDQTAKQIETLETRVKEVEQRVWLASGVATTLGALVGVAVPFLTR